MNQVELDEQLEALKGKLVVRRDGQPFAIPAEEWQHRFRTVTPKDLYERFSRAAGEENVTTVTVDTETNREKTAIRIGFVAADGSPGENLMEFHLNERGVAGAKTMKLAKQGVHQAKRLMREEVATLKEMGAHQLDIAASDIGGYAWLKYGFLPADPLAWIQLQTFLEKRLYEQPPMIEFENTGYHIKPGEYRLIREILDSSFEEMPDRLPHLAELKRPLFTTEDGKTITVGKATMIMGEGEAWLGRLPLNDNHPQFKRFQSYIDSAPEPLRSKG